ncbi:MAG: 16S rRNA (cytosine(1402)-N(4))-methyltransferase RsmH [Gammaproteobacteria bacterium]|nr:16S rRNA (cytosine(1402)-N(4))-methyltransferase RsmH [Gammaproteobacteria bacterium]
MKDPEHKTVLLHEAITALAIKPDGIYIDGTFGRGGHSKLILENLGAEGRLIAIDRDLTAVQYARQNFTDARFSIIHAPFSAIEKIARQENIVGQVDGLLLDLGVSSPQLDEGARGFSFQQDGPLDMRMDTTQTMTAASWLMFAKEQEIADVFHEYGEERYAKRIARAIVEARNKQDLTSTTQLAEIIKTAHPRWEKHHHPATRCFQAIRIFVNRELHELPDCLAGALKVLTIGGRLAVISFHSLEDRIVKKFIQREASLPEALRFLPMTKEQLTKEYLNSKLRRVGKAIKSSDTEIATNPRSRSATLRIAEKIA